MRFRYLGACCFVVLIIAQALFAQVPRTISYQGVLTDDGGTALSGPYNFQFRIYAAAEGGPILWQEDHAGVMVEKGIFNVILGGYVSLGGLEFDQPYFLEILVAGGVLSPRSALTSAAYSLCARAVEDGAVSTDKIQDGAVTQAKLDPAVSLPAGGPAGGDLSGSYPDPVVSAVRGRSVSEAEPTAGQVLKWDGSQWAPQADDGLSLPFSGSTDAGDYGIAVGHTATSGNTVGGLFTSLGELGRGVRGQAQSLTGRNYGGHFESFSNYGVGVYGEAGSATGPTYGGYFWTPSTGGTGVAGIADAVSGTTYGGAFLSGSSAGMGVMGLAYAETGANMGGYFYNSSPEGYGVYSIATATTGAPRSGYFLNLSTGGIAVHGEAMGGTGTNVGGHFVSQSTSGHGVSGAAMATSGDAYGGHFVSMSPDGAGAVGIGGAETGNSFGGWFLTFSPGGIGAIGIATKHSGTSCGVFGVTYSPDGYGVYSQGQFAATGTKSFQIDHPLDPAGRYLNHFCAEGPEPLNIYSGNAVLDGAGEAVVELPAYFEAINKDFRYQLTCIGGFAPVYIAEEIANNRFRIAGGQSGMKVSWRVEAVRNDRWVERHGAIAEQDKPAERRGKYVHPELYGLPREMAIHHFPEPEQPLYKEPVRVEVDPERIKEQAMRQESPR